MNRGSVNIGIRVSPNYYVTGLMLALFFGAFCLYLGWNISAFLLAATAVVLIPLFAFTDRVVFDGKRLRRTGVLPRFWAWFNDYYFVLRVRDIEQVESQSMRALKRGGNVFYRYRTTISGRGLRFVVSSGGEDFRRLIRTVLGRLPNEVLDNRSIELRDYLSDPKETLMKADFVHIPSADVLEDSIRNLRRPELKQTARRSDGDPAKASELRQLGNELRLSGYLLQALEAFRRAMLITPEDNWLLFESARCLNSYALAERDDRLMRRSHAMLRLVSRRATGDAELLARVGECYFQFGDWRRAQSAFLRSTGLIDESFRAVRGMAEIALREGKLAHVVHNFIAACRIAGSPSLRRWSRSEADYFSRLNDDDEYLDMEVTRINLLETFARSKRTAFRIALLGLPTIILGIFIDDALVTNIGWAVAVIALTVWFAMIVAVNLFSSRVPFETFSDN